MPRKPRAQLNRSPSQSPKVNNPKTRGGFRFNQEEFKQEPPRYSRNGILAQTAIISEPSCAQVFLLHLTWCIHTYVCGRALDKLALGRVRRNARKSNAVRQIYRARRQLYTQRAALPRYLFCPVELQLGYTSL